MKLRTGLLLLSSALVVAAPPAMARRSPGSIMQSIDTNQDGKIDLAEAKEAASKLFDKLDVNKDGKLGAKEFKGRLSAGEIAAADPDKDKTLTKAEYLALVEERFKAADKDHDGTIDIHELTSVAGGALVKLINFVIVE